MKIFDYLLWVSVYSTQYYTHFTASMKGQPQDTDCLHFTDTSDGSSFLDLVSEGVQSISYTNFYCYFGTLYTALNEVPRFQKVTK